MECTQMTSLELREQNLEIKAVKYYLQLKRDVKILETHRGSKIKTISKHFRQL